MSAEAQRAVAVAVAVARAQGLRVDEPVVLAEGYSVRVHVAPAPVVVRVPTLAAQSRPPIRPWLERELAVASWLVAAGAPVIPPADEVDPGPHEHDGAVVSLWRFVELDPMAMPSPQTFGAALGELHEVLAGYPGELPLLAGPAADIPYGLDRAEAEGLLGVADLAVARRAQERLAVALAEPSGFLRPLHGDAHTGNLLVARDGRLLWNDWEDVCCGPVEWDLASMTVGPAAVAAYPGDLDPERLAIYRDVRRLQVLAGTVGLSLDFDGRAELVADLLRALN